MTNYAKTPRTLLRGTKMAAVLEMIGECPMTAEQIKDRLKLNSVCAARSLIGDLRQRGYTICCDDHAYASDQAPIY